MSDTLNKKQLYNLVWKRPMVDVAKEYGLSDRGLAKLCERNGIPVPPRGYWAKKQAGQKVVRPPLLVLDPKEPETTVLMKEAIQKQKEWQQANREPLKPALPDEIQEAIKRESLPEHQVKVSKTLANPHTIVAAWIKDEERQFESYRKYGGWKPAGVTELERRRKRIISALLKALEARGFKLEVERDYRDFIWVKHQWDHIGFSVNERFRQYRRELTEEERKDRWRENQKWTQGSEATNMLRLRICTDPRSRSYDPKDFEETAENPLENQLNAVIAAIIERLWWVKKARMDREEAERQRWKRQQEAERRAKLLKEEQDRKSALEMKAANWKKAADIRDYVAAVLMACDQDQLTLDKKTVERWKEWALAHAQELDPIASGAPLIELTDMQEKEGEDHAPSDSFI